MSEIENFLPWQASTWFEESSGWIKNCLQQNNLELSSAPIIIHSAPWSVVFKVPTNNGVYFFKALCPVLKHEALVAKQLSFWQPNLVQPALEIEPDRGWLLMPDGGTTLRQVLEKNPSLIYWKKILPIYARFQQSLIPHRQELLALGVKDRRLQLLPMLAKKLVADREAMCIGKPDGLNPEGYETLKRVMPIVQQMCERLANFRIPETLQHDDFHDGNIFANNNDFKFFDWAESFIAHPFFSLVVTLRSIAYRFKLDEHSPELNELENLYLSEWRAYASLDALREALDLAMALGRINRALTWHMVVSSLPEPFHAQEADAIPGWLQLFLEKIIPYV
ncbi:MAG: hypothetical protein CVU42_03500 [Chloroflexi bacterium HGW-Chloroflexi-4]|jgi:hypothetical protein|nr:MAG: hypothetical protein CVU42_03500 [Chloroflexi bacterium HGW-Chloroflexi-4]